MMNQIRRKGDSQLDEFKLLNKLWGSEGYKPEVSAYITYDDVGFYIKFLINETAPLCDKKNHLEAVFEDSCVEFFVNFAPDYSNKYINFEVNAAGAMNVAYRTGRYDPQKLTLEEIEGFQISSDIHDDYWTVSYMVSFSFIKKYYPMFDIQQCEYILGNLYKCGAKTEMKHYLTYFNIDLEKPDFHRPEYFGKIMVQH